MRQSKQLFLIASLCAAAIFSGCNSNTIGPSPYSAPSNLTYSQPNVVYVKDSTIVDNVPIVTGTVIRYSISPDLPNGLRFDDSSGIISGRPYFIFPATQYRVIATNSGGSDTTFVTIAVANNPYYLAYASPPACAAGAALNIVPVVLGNLTQFSVSPVLPSGLSLNASTGLISGTPIGASPAGNYVVTGVHAKDTVRATVRILVYNTAPGNMVYTRDTVDYIGGLSISGNSPSVTGTVTHYSISPALPAGLVLNDTTGVISGIPTALSPKQNYTVTANNALGSTTTIVNIRVAWMARSTGADGALVSVIWTGSQLVAVGSKGVVVTSPDGINWKTQESGTTNSLQSVVWNGSQLVAVGSGGSILTSPNGTTWTARISGTLQGLNSIVWAGSQFVAVGNKGTILTSSDAATWTVRALGLSKNLNSVVWTGNGLVVVGDTLDLVLTSPNGSVWTAKTATGLWVNTFSIAWNGNQFVAASWPFTVTSPDALTWTEQGRDLILSVIWTGTQWVGVGSDGVLASQNGLVWDYLTPDNYYLSQPSVTSMGNNLVVTNDASVLTSF